MIWAATEALSQCSTADTNGQLPLLPSLNNAQDIAKKIAVAVAQTAIDEGLADHPPKINLKAYIEQIFWEPCYLPFRKKEN